MSKSKILFLMSGSIAAFKACQVISRLVQEGHEVQVAMTPSAREFIGAATIEGLTGRPPLVNLWAKGKVMDHIHLTRWADMAVLCPASATTLARLTTGLADDPVSALALAWPGQKPFHIFPAMNSAMLENPATQENLARLAQRGFLIAATSSGSLACGENGAGRLLEPEMILQTLSLTKPKLGKVLITLGATREPLDGIRYISNVSTGQTGAHLAELLKAQGFEVSALCGRGAVRPQNLTTESFEDFVDLNQKLHQKLAAESFTAVIHAAAVSDFSVSEILKDDQSVRLNSSTKMSSGGELTVRLKPNFKILDRLKEYSQNKNIRVIGFKLTLNASPSEALAAAQALFKGGVDAVVVNDWSRVNHDRTRHPGTLLESTGQMTEFNDLERLSKILLPQIPVGG